MRRWFGIRLAAGLSSLGIAILPVSTGHAQEVGHTLGMIHEHSFGGVALQLLLANGQVIESSGIRFEVADLKALTCLELETARDGTIIVYSAFTPIDPSNRTDLDFIQFRMQDGVATEFELGISSERTSVDRCGAGAVTIRSVDGLAWKAEVTD